MACNKTKSISFKVSANFFFPPQKGAPMSPSCILGFLRKSAWNTPSEGTSDWYDYLRNVGERAFKRNGRHGKLTGMVEILPISSVQEGWDRVFQSYYSQMGLIERWPTTLELTQLRGYTHGEVGAWEKYVGVWPIRNSSTIEFKSIFHQERGTDSPL